MEGNYIVKLKDGTIYCFYYIKSFGIAYRVYNLNWSKETILINDGSPHFSVSLDTNGFIYLFCQDSLGDLYSSTNRSGTWATKIILKSQSFKFNNVLLRAIIAENGMSLIYNTFFEEDKSSYLVFQDLNEDGLWSPYKRIDKYTKANKHTYSLQMTSGTHGLIFYQCRTPENTLGYRELMPGKIGSFCQFYKSGYQIIDTSYLTTSTTVHILIIVKNIFSTSIIYRKKEDLDFLPPIVLWEGGRLANCLLSFVNNSLHATYMNNGSLYICTSIDKGDSFSRPIRYKKKLCTTPVKATYLSLLDEDDSDYFVREVYVDKYTPWDIQILPELCNNFYNKPSTQLVVKQEELVPDFNEVNSTININKEDTKASNIQAKAKQSITKDTLKDTISTEEKDQKIKYLITLLQKRKDEFEDIQTEYLHINNKLKLENQSLLKKITALESKSENFEALSVNLKKQPIQYFDKPITNKNFNNKNQHE
jgi:hypothetical protein